MLSTERQYLRAQDRDLRSGQRCKVKSLRMETYIKQPLKTASRPKDSADLQTELSKGRQEVIIMAKTKTSKKPAPAKLSKRQPLSKGQPKPAAKKQTPKGLIEVLRSKTSTSKTGMDAGFTRRPDANLPPPKAAITLLTDDLLVAVNFLNSFAANLRALDRQRHNGVGIRRLGFIEAAFRLSSKFPQYFPHWLNTEKFQRDLDLFNAVRSLVEVCRSLEEKAWNINVEAADMVYTDALEYYSPVREAAERRVDAAESIYNELFEFFRHSPMESDEPTQKKAKRDADALIKGKKEGKMVIENRKPKVIGGKHEIIDETYKDSAAFRETEAGSINE